MKSFFNITRKHAEEPAVLTATQLRQRDVNLLALRKREREHLAERVAAGVADPTLLDRADREIRNIERQIETRDADLASATDRVARRQRDMPQDEIDLAADLRAFMADVATLSSRADALKAKAVRFRTLYGREVGVHVLDVPMWLGLIFTLANIFGSSPRSHLSMWLHRADAQGFGIERSKAA